MFANGRRPVAVMFTDMVGFSSLTQRDEPLTLRLLEEQRKVVRELVGHFGGQEIKTIGDGFLLEFAAPEQACRCALELQRTLDQRNRDPDVDPIRLRVGIHVGEVVHKEGDIFGDTVNVASRLVPLARPGGICISGPVLDRVRAALPFETTPLPPGLRGIGSSPEIYQIELPWLRSPPAVGPRRDHARPPSVAREAPFVGREGLLATLQAFVEGVAEGLGETVFLTGEPGIGKRRLVEEALDYARSRGVRTLVARCSDVEGTGPLAPWSEIFLRVVREDTRASLLRYVGPAGGELGRLFPELAAKLGPLPALPPGEPAQERLRFFDAAAEFLKRVGLDAPLVIVLEDLGAADADSLQLFRYVVGRLHGSRVGFLASYSELDAVEPSPLHDLLARLHEDRLASTHRLERLGPEETATLVRGLLQAGGPPPDRLASMVHAKTGGNPFFAEEVVRDFVESGTLVATPEGWSLSPGARPRLPPTVRALLARRLGRLGEGTRELLRAASVLGPEFDLEVLRFVAGTPPETFVECMERALAAGVLGEERRRVGCTFGRFQDDQIWEAVYEGISPPRRRLLHGRAAKALVQVYRDALDEHAAEVAGHYLEAADRIPGVAHASRAARRAMRAYAYEQAAEILRRALGVLTTDGDPRVRAQVLEDLADALLAQGQLQPSVEHLREAAGLWRALGDELRAGELLARVAEAFWHFANDEGPYTRAFEEARGALERGGGGPPLARLLAQAAVSFPWFGRTDKGKELARQALALAGDLRLPDVERRAHLALCLSASMTEREEGLRHLASWTALAATRSSPGVLAFPADEYVTAAKTEFSALGDWTAPVRRLEAAREAARDARFFDMVAYLQLNLSEFYCEGGQVGAAFRALDEVDRLVGMYGFGGETAQNYLQLSQVDRSYYEGRFEEAHERTVRLVGDIERAAPRYLGLIGFYGILGEICSSAGRLEEARGHLTRCWELARTSGYPLNQASRVVSALSSLVGVLVALGQDGEATSTLEELRRLAAQLDHGVARGFALRAEGALRRGRKNWHAASQAYGKAARVWQEAGWAYWAEVARYEQGDALRRDGDRGGAKEAFTLAVTRFRAMSRPDWAERAERAKRSVD